MAVFIVGASLALAVSSQSAAGPRAHAAAATVPSGAFDTLKEMNRQMARIIDQNLSGHDLKVAVKRVETLKTELVTQDFADQKVFGLSFPSVFLPLERIDVRLEEARIDDLNGSEEAKLIRVKGVKRLKDILEKLLLKANQTPPSPLPEPKLTPVRAYFTPAPAGQHCRPPYCTTVYAEYPTGVNLSYSWTVKIDADPDCDRGFQPKTPNPNEATWYHADVSDGGYCNHNGMTYDAEGSGHPGTVTVTVSNESWSCVATFYGTQGPQAQTTWEGPPQQPCQRKP